MNNYYRVVEVKYPFRTVYIIKEWSEDLQVWSYMEEHGEYLTSEPAINKAKELEMIRRWNTPIEEKVVWE